jgi:hypothetical protein
MKIPTPINWTGYLIPVLDLLVHPIFLYNDIGPREIRTKEEKMYLLSDVLVKAYLDERSRGVEKGEYIHHGPRAASKSSLPAILGRLLNRFFSGRQRDLSPGGGMVIRSEQRRAPGNGQAY